MAIWYSTEKQTVGHFCTSIISQVQLGEIIFEIVIGIAGIQIFMSRKRRCIRIRMQIKKGFYSIFCIACWFLTFFLLFSSFSCSIFISIPKYFKFFVFHALCECNLQVYEIFLISNGSVKTLLNTYECNCFKILLLFSPLICRVHNEIAEIFMFASQVQKTQWVEIYIIIFRSGILFLNTYVRTFLRVI